MHVSHIQILEEKYSRIKQTIITAYLFAKSYLIRLAAHSGLARTWVVGVATTPPIFLKQPQLYLIISAKMSFHLQLS